MNLNLASYLTSPVRTYGGDDVALNPQPLPPKENAALQIVDPSLFTDGDIVNPRRMSYLTTNGILNPGQSVGFNPQPDPPRDLAAAKYADFDAVLLNPQPLPPKELGLAGLLHKLDWAALNPQPLPPKELGLAQLFSSNWRQAVDWEIPKTIGEQMPKPGDGFSNGPLGRGRKADEMVSLFRPLGGWATDNTSAVQFELNRSTEMFNRAMQTSSNIFAKISSVAEQITQNIK